MTPETDLQAAVENAFAWVHRVYREAHALLNEASHLLGLSGFECWGKPEPLFGRETAYLLAQYFSTPEEISAASGTDIFWAVSFYPDSKYRRGSGARLLAGTAKRTREDVTSLLKVVNVAARAPGTGDFFRTTSRPDDRLVVCEPADAGKVEFQGIDVVRSVALPLTSFRTSDDLSNVVRAVVEMRRGQDGPARALLARTDAS